MKTEPAIAAVPHVLKRKGVSSNSMLSADGSVSLGNLSLGPSDHDSIIDDRSVGADTIDTRKFRSAAKNLLGPSKHTLEKTLLKVYKRTLTKEASCSEGSLSSGIEFYKSGPPLSGAMHASISSVDSADSLFWSAFQMFAQRMDNDYIACGTSPSKGGSSRHLEEDPQAAAGIPVSKLGKAMQRIVYWITSDHVIAVANSFGLLDEPHNTSSRCIGWPEFIIFATRVVETLPIPPAGKFIRSKEKKNNQRSTSTTSPNHGLYGSISSSAPDLQSIRTDRRAELPLSSSMHQLPMGKVLQKGTIHLTSLSDLPGLNAHKNYAKEEIVDIYRREERYKRKQEAAKAALVLQQPPGSPTSAGSQSHLSYPNTGGGSRPEGDPLEKIRKPLISKQVYEMIHVGDSYPVKWEAMKDKRDRRYENEERRLARADMKATLNRLVLIAERSNLHKALDAQSSNLETILHQEKVQVLHQQCDETQSNIKKNTEAVKAMKARNSAALREALSSSTTVAQSTLEQDKVMKATYKEPTPGKIRADSTTAYQPPEALVQSVKSAKKQTDFDQAKKAIKMNFEQTMDERIKSYSIGKQEAILKASMKGAAITVLPSPGPDLFEDPLVERSRSKGVLLPLFLDSSVSTAEEGWRINLNASQRRSLVSRDNRAAATTTTTTKQQNHKDRSNSSRQHRISPPPKMLLDRRDSHPHHMGVRSSSSARAIMENQTDTSAMMMMDTNMNGSMTESDLAGDRSESTDYEIRGRSIDTMDATPYTQHHTTFNNSNTHTIPMTTMGQQQHHPRHLALEHPHTPLHDVPPPHSYIHIHPYPQSSSPTRPQSYNMDYGQTAPTIPTNKPRSAMKQQNHTTPPVRNQRQQITVYFQDRPLVDPDYGDYSPDNSNDQFDDESVNSTTTRVPTQDFRV